MWSFYYNRSVYSGLNKNAVPTYFFHLQPNNINLIWKVTVLTKLNVAQAVSVFKTSSSQEHFILETVFVEEDQKCRDIFQVPVELGLTGFAGVDHLPAQVH